MFTPAEIEGAFRKLFGMYNKEKVSLLKSAFKEEIACISTDTLAWKYAKSAVMPHEFREMLSNGDLDEWQGLPLLDMKAAYVAEEVGSSYTWERFQVIHSTELWLLEDMTFVTIHCTEFFDVEDDTSQNGLESRTFHAFVECSNDIPVSEENLIYALEDTCLFAEAEQKIEAMDEEE